MVNNETVFERVMWKARWGMAIFAAILVISGVIGAIIFIWNGDIILAHRHLTDEEFIKYEVIDSQLDFISKIFWTLLLFLIVYGIAWAIIACLYGKMQGEFD